MTNDLTLPVDVTRGKDLPLMCGLIIVTALLMPIVLYSILSQTPSLPKAAVILISLIYPIMNLGVGVFLIARVKPAKITISRTTVAVEALPVLGYRGAWEENRSLGDFDSVMLRQVQIKNRTVWKMALKGKAGKSDVTFNAPQQKTAPDFAHQLGAATGLKVMTQNG
jgi:hypothetical protein